MSVAALPAHKTKIVATIGPASDSPDDDDQHPSAPVSTSRV